MTSNVNSPESLADLNRLLHRKPGYLLRRVHQAAVSIFMEETAEFDLTPVQYAILAAVSVFPGIDQLRVANAVGFDRTTISGVLDRLEAKNLLVRTVSTSDRRARMLFPTPKGIKLLADIEDATIHVQKRILEPLSQSEQKLFIEYLNRLVVAHSDPSHAKVGNPPASSGKSQSKRRRG